MICSAEEVAGINGYQKPIRLRLALNLYAPDFIKEVVEKMQEGRLSRDNYRTRYEAYKGFVTWLVKADYIKKQTVNKKTTYTSNDKRIRARGSCLSITQEDAVSLFTEIGIIKSDEVLNG